MDINITPIAGNYQLNTTHNVQPNANAYFMEKKFVSIHSEDRNVLTYPNSGEFQITLPQTLNNVVKVKFSTFDFPANYDVFSRERENTKLAFSMVEPYLPTTSPTLLSMAIYECLVSIKNTVLIVEIATGFYTQNQMVTELTNRFNKVISDKLHEFVLNNIPKYGSLLPITDATYDRFVVIYNSVQQTIMFGNTADQFTLNNSNIFAFSQTNSAVQCRQHPLPDFSSWGLPSNLGLKREDMTSSPAPYRRIFYGEINPGDNGYWLLPNPLLGNAVVYYLECPYKINLMGFANFYLSIEQLNCIDVTTPFFITPQKINTGTTTGTVNAAFAKIQIPTTPLSQWFGGTLDVGPYIHFAPPRDKVSQLHIKLAYHDGTIVNFQNFNYSFILQFEILQPQILRKGTVTTGNVGYLFNR